MVRIFLRSFPFGVEFFHESLSSATNPHGSEKEQSTLPIPSQSPDGKSKLKLDSSRLLVLGQDANQCVCVLYVNPCFNYSQCSSVDDFSVTMTNRIVLNTNFMKLREGVYF